MILHTGVLKIYLLTYVRNIYLTNCCDSRVVILVLRFSCCDSRVVILGCHSRVVVLIILGHPVLTILWGVVWSRDFAENFSC